MLGDALRAAGVADARIWQLIQLVKIGLTHSSANSLEMLVNDASVSQFLNINTFNDLAWFNQEQFNVLVNWLQVVGAYRILRDKTNTAKENAALIQQSAQWNAWRDAEKKSEYQVEKLLAATRPPKKTKSARVATKSVAKKKIVTAAKTQKAKSKTVAKKPTASNKAAASKATKKTRNKKG